MYLNRIFPDSSKYLTRFIPAYLIFLVSQPANVRADRCSGVILASRIAAAASLWRLVKRVT